MKEARYDFTRQLLIDAGITEGMRVLDVGCGFGDVTFLVGELVGEEGEVLGIDRDEKALSVARGRAVERASRPAPAAFHQGSLTDVPDALGTFDAIVGRRVLMYQADTVAAARALAARLRPGGILVFQEHDTTMVPTGIEAFALHRQAQGWLQQMIAREGADLHIGFNLYAILSKAGLKVDSLRAECVVQTPDKAYALGSIVEACLPRILALGVATSEEVGIETLQRRLDDERMRSSSLYIGDVMFGVWARKEDGGDTQRS